MKTINIIAAVAKNGVIGNNGQLPWRLPQDLQRFKRLTEFGTVIMGRKTWESLPGAVRPLKNRENYVLSREPSYFAPGAIVVSSLQDAIASAACEHVWVIGGAQIYAAAFPLAAKVYITEVNAEPEGDARFPDLSFEDFGLTKCEHWKDEHGTWHRFLEFART